MDALADWQNSRLVSIEVHSAVRPLTHTRAWHSAHVVCLWFLFPHVGQNIAKAQRSFLSGGVDQPRLFMRMEG